MSASTTARWNAIPMSRELDSAPANKRSRSNDDDDSSEDNVSLVSRSPSPEPDKDVEMKDVYGYDEHVKGVAREVVTVETKIKSSNKGFAMLAKMGWTEGAPLGLSGDGRVDPIPFSVKQDATGLGKVTQDFRMIETTVSQRRNLDSERMRFETVEQRQQREAAVAQKAAVQSEISSVLRPFYCELCDKQFKNVAQYDEHTNSYAHHHKARARDMNANHPMRAGGREEADRRKEKERQREEKELRKLAKAAGIKLAAPPVAHSTSPAPSSEAKGFKKSGWASVGGTLTASTSSTSAAAPFGSSSGCARVSSSAPPPPPDIPPPPPPTSQHQGFRSGGWTSLSESMSSFEALSISNPSTGRWTSTNTPSRPTPPLPPDVPPLPPPSDVSPPLPPSSPPPPPPPPSWSQLPPLPPSNPASSSTIHRWDAKPPMNNTATNSSQLPPNPTQVQTPAPPNPNFNPTSNRTPKPKVKSKLEFDEEATARSRGNWQSFQKMRGRR